MTWDIAVMIRLLWAEPFGGNESGGNQKGINCEQKYSVWSTLCCYIEGTQHIWVLCSIIALEKHTGTTLGLQEAHSHMHCWYFTCGVRTCVLHLEILKADIQARAGLYSRRGISSAWCFHLLCSRSNKGCHCQSSSTGGLQPHRFQSCVGPCHLSRLSLLC